MSERPGLNDGKASDWLRLCENRAVSDLEGGVRLPHSSEQDLFRALWFLIPSRLEGKWGAVDWKAGGLANAQHSPPGHPRFIITKDMCTTEHLTMESHEIDDNNEVSP